MERQFQETSCRKSSTLPSSRFHYIFANFESVIVSTNKQCVLRFTLAIYGVVCRGSGQPWSSCRVAFACEAHLESTARVNYGTSFFSEGKTGRGGEDRIYQGAESKGTLRNVL
jgi:hypothetical protein